VAQAHARRCGPAAALPQLSSTVCLRGTGHGAAGDASRRGGGIVTARSVRKGARRGGVGWSDARQCRDTNASEEIFGDVRDVEMSMPIGPVCRTVLGKKGSVQTGRTPVCKHLRLQNRLARSLARFRIRTMPAAQTICRPLFREDMTNLSRFFF
jgi:hypothetical protein